jgi:hypothetical protein
MSATLYKAGLKGVQRLVLSCTCRTAICAANAQAIKLVLHNTVMFMRAYTRT